MHAFCEIKKEDGDIRITGISNIGVQVNLIYTWWQPILLHLLVRKCSRKCRKGNQQLEYEREMKAAYRHQNTIPFLTHCSWTKCYIRAPGSERLAFCVHSHLLKSVRTSVAGFRPPWTAPVWLPSGGMRPMQFSCSLGHFPGNLPKAALGIAGANFH